MSLYVGLLAMTLVLCAFGNSPGQATPGSMTLLPSLVPILADSLQARNPALATCEFLEIRAPFPGSRSRIAIARGIRADRDFKGNFADELFAVAVLNDSLTRITAILDCFPTRSWNDYIVRLTTVTVDSAYIEGRGATYDDQQPILRGYAWNGQ